MSDREIVVADLKEAVRKFVHERDWEKYHNPKNLAESICIEAAELLQLFQWTNSEETAKVKTDANKMTHIKEELADVMIYCVSMANTLEIDLTNAIIAKIENNKKRYPIEEYRGKAP